jgi:phosphate transport system permease protein
LGETAVRVGFTEKRRRFTDAFARRTIWLVTVFCFLLLILMAFGLVWKSKTILETKPLAQLLFGTSWHPMKGEFGFFPFIMGTLWVTGVSVVIAVPLSLLTAIYLAEYAPRLVREWSKPLIDLLAGIPSVIYGVWGILVIVPFVKDTIGPLFGVYTSGYTVLSGGIVLAVMIFPVIIHVSVEVFHSVPYELRAASWSLGATKWQTVKHVVIRKAMPGIVAANMLGFSRAFGETMAVLMVAGNVANVPHSPLDPAYPLPALIANNYGEMLSVPLYDSALLLSALLLFAVVLFFSILSRIVLSQVERRLN